MCQYEYDAWRASGQSHTAAKEFLETSRGDYNSKKYRRVWTKKLRYWEDKLKRRENVKPNQ